MSGDSRKTLEVLTMAMLELYGTAGCQHTQELRESLKRTRREFIEYDIVTDSAAWERMRSFGGSFRTVPILVEDGKIIQVSGQGRGCIAGSQT